MGAVRPVFAVAALCACLALTPPAAHAGKVTIEGTTLVYRASPGEDNIIEVSCSQEGCAVNDYGPEGDRVDRTDTPPSGCHYENREGTECAAGAFTDVRVVAEDGTDNVTVTADGNPPARLEGGSGNDRLFAGGTRGDFVGGDGDDELVEGGDNTAGGTFDGGDGDDTIGASPRATVTGGDGNDTISVGHDSTTDAGPGHDKVLGGGATDTIEGGPGDDRLLGGCGNDIVLGGDGDDLIGADDEDELVGLEEEGPERCFIAPLPGTRDRLEGGSGRDKLYAGPAGRGGGRRILDGGPGRDLLAVIGARALYRARDGERDKIYCGRRQTALIDRVDRIVGRERSRCRRKRG